MAIGEPPVVESVWIDAPPDRVFPFFTDPQRITRWLGEAAELDPTPGGRFAVDINRHLVRGSYLELAPPHRVIFSWGHAGSAALPPGASRVEVELEPDAGGTRVTLTHRDLAGAERADHARGWPIKLAELVTAAG